MDKKEIRRFNIIISEKDPFEIDENFLSIQRSWDWFFEQHSYEVKKQTLREFDKLINLIVDNRDTIEEIFSMCMINNNFLKNAIDQNLHSFLISQYSRMIKTSKIIQDLVVEGNYIESKSLLRTNFERMILINYFLFNTEKLEEYQDAIQKEDRKILHQYHIKDMILKLEKNYSFYKYLCHFVHASSHINDLMNINIQGEDYGVQFCHNFFEGGESSALLATDNNLLLEAFDPINRYLTAICPKKYFLKIKRQFNTSKKLRKIVLVSSLPKK
jgi:hypothetical protein